MKPAWFFLAAVLFLVPCCQAGQIPGNVHQISSDNTVINSGYNAPDFLANLENMQKMLKEMHLLTEQESLSPRQQAEINALMKQLQSLRQQANHASTDQYRHQKKIQEIQQRLDVIKRQMRQKPNNPHKLPVYICAPGPVQPGPPGLPLDMNFFG